jgi:hypothetical protein
MLAGYVARGPEIGTATFSKSFTSAPSVVVNTIVNSVSVFVVYCYDITTTNFKYKKDFIAVPLITLRLRNPLLG